MKKIFSAIFFIFLLTSVCAIRINEVELNPEDGTYGKEWIELYNDEKAEVDISGWGIYDGLPKKRFTIPNGTFIEEEDFYVAEFSSAVLNNDGDFVILYDSDGEEIDRTDTLEDFDWSYETWQLCDSWEFAEATKGEENECDIEEETEDKKTENDEEIKEVEYNGPEEKKENKTPEVINLNPKNIKSKETRKSLDGEYGKYGFVAFCILLGLLFVLKKKPKNEFK